MKVCDDALVTQFPSTTTSPCSYGLLGSSGCGKTTLLRCLLGRLRLESGRVTTLGHPPGSRGHNIPGRDVGYMPQVRGNTVDGHLLLHINTLPRPHGKSAQQLRSYRIEMKQPFLHEITVTSVKLMRPRIGQSTSCACNG